MLKARGPLGIPASTIVHDMTTILYNSGNIFLKNGAIQFGTPQSCICCCDGITKFSKSSSLDVSWRRYACRYNDANCTSFRDVVSDLILVSGTLSWIKCYSIGWIQWSGIVNYEVYQQTTTCGSFGTLVSQTTPTLQITYRCGIGWYFGYDINPGILGDAFGTEIWTQATAGIVLQGKDFCGADYVKTYNAASTVTLINNAGCDGGGAP